MDCDCFTTECKMVAMSGHQEDRSGVFSVINSVTDEKEGECGILIDKEFHIPHSPKNLLKKVQIN